MVQLRKKKKKKPGYNVKTELFLFGAINVLVLLFKSLRSLNAFYLQILENLESQNGHKLLILVERNVPSDQE